MAAKRTRLNHKVVIQLHLMAQSSTIFSSRSRLPVRKLLDTTLILVQGGFTVRRLLRIVCSACYFRPKVQTVLTLWFYCKQRYILVP